MKQQTNTSLKSFKIITTAIIICIFISIIITILQYMDYELLILPYWLEKIGIRHFYQNIKSTPYPNLILISLRILFYGAIFTIITLFHTVFKKKQTIQTNNLKLYKLHYFANTFTFNFSIFVYISWILTFFYEPAFSFIFLIQNYPIIFALFVWGYIIINLLNYFIFLFIKYFSKTTLDEQEYERTRNMLCYNLTINPVYVSLFCLCLYVVH